MLMLLVSLNALAAGYSFMIDPTGGGIGIKTNYLRNSAPFDDFFVPGVVLFSIIGVLGCLTFVLTTFKKDRYPILLLIYGCILLCWIIIQLMMVRGFHVLHLIIGIIGAFLIFSGYVLKNTDTSIANRKVP